MRVELDLGLDQESVDSIEVRATNAHSGSVCLSIRKERGAGAARESEGDRDSPAPVCGGPRRGCSPGHAKLGQAQVEKTFRWGNGIALQPGVSAKLAGAVTPTIRSRLRPCAASHAWSTMAVTRQLSPRRRAPLWRLAPPRPEAAEPAGPSAASRPSAASSRRVRRAVRTPTTLHAGSQDAAVPPVKGSARLGSVLGQGSRAAGARDGRPEADQGQRQQHRDRARTGRRAVRDRRLPPSSDARSTSRAQVNGNSLRDGLDRRRQDLDREVDTAQQREAGDHDPQQRGRPLEITVNAATATPSEAKRPTQPSERHRRHRGGARRRCGCPARRSRRRPGAARARRAWPAARSYAALERMIRDGLAGVAISASKVPVVCSSRSLRENEARPT